jgi:putative peptidoglycan lipid II flippase
MGLIVSVFMLGLLPFTLFYVLLRGYYALEDTRTPFWITVGFSVLLLALAYPLFAIAPRAGGQQVAAIALAYSLSYWAGFLLAWWLLARRLGSMESARTAWVIIRTFLAAAIAVGVMVAVLALFRASQPSVEVVTWQVRGSLLLGVVLTSAVGLLVFLGAAWAMRIGEVSDVLSLVRRLAGRVRKRGGQ